METFVLGIQAVDDRRLSSTKCDNASVRTSHLHIHVDR